jgi:hypothetical protein
MVTPFGGLAFLAGWLCLIVCAWPRGVEVYDHEEEKEEAKPTASTD